MDRRRCLALVGAATTGSLTGCTLSLTGESDESPEPAPTPTPTPTSTPTQTTAAPTTAERLFGATEVQRQITLAGVDGVPDYPLAIDVTLLNGTVTSEDPARVEVTVTNEAGEKRWYTNNEGKCAIFNRGGGTSDPEGLHLHQPDFPGYLSECGEGERRGNQWRLDLPASEHCGVLLYGCDPVVYDPGETKATTYQVWDDHTAEGYMPPGTYRFEREVTAGRFDEGETFQWGFSLAVERPK